jgi:hypothetical protein
MSAPDTNIEKQKKRHAGPLIGITAGLVFACIIGIAVLMMTSPEQGEGEADIVPSPDADAVVVTE